jgi:hypothetical protein
VVKGLFEAAVNVSGVFCRWRSEVSSLSRRASPANLTSGGMTIPATVPHPGRESFERTALLFKTTLGATAGDPRNGGGARPNPIRNGATALAC